MESEATAAGPNAPNAATNGATSGTSASPSTSSQTESFGAAITADGAAAHTSTPKERVRQFLSGRGFDPIALEADGWEAKQTTGGGVWVSIPCRRGGKAYNHKYRNVDSKAWRKDPGGESELWNIDCLDESEFDGEPLVITEGEFDAQCCKDAGYGRVVSVPDGWTAGLENEQGQAKLEVFVRNEAKIKEKVKVIISAVDDDEVGRSLRLAVNNFFDEHTHKWVTWPEGSKDANDVRINHGLDALSACIDGARTVDPAGGMITGFSDLPAEIPRQVWKLGIPAVDRQIAFRTREVSVITGVPGSGKTTFLTWCEHHLVKQHDIRCGVSVFETEADEIRDHLVLMRTGLDFAQLVPEQQQRELAILDRNFRVFHRVETADSVHGMGWLKTMIHTLAARDGCKFIAIDPWNELEHLPASGESMTTYTNFAISALRRWAAKYDIHICVVAHPFKLKNGEVPTGYHIAESAAWFNKPGLGLTVHFGHDDTHGEFVQLVNWKVRSRKMTGCKPSKVKLQFDEGQMVYRGLSK